LIWTFDEFLVNSVDAENFDQGGRRGHHFEAEEEAENEDRDFSCSSTITAAFALVTSGAGATGVISSTGAAEGGGEITTTAGAGEGEGGDVVGGEALPVFEADENHGQNQLLRVELGAAASALLSQSSPS
jgi:hypothetical protein